MGNDTQNSEQDISYLLLGHDPSGDEENAEDERKGASCLECSSGVKRLPIYGH